MSIASLRKTKRLVLGDKSNGMLMTPQEFDAAEDWDNRYSYELIHGVLIVSPLPAEDECGPNEELGYWFLLYRDKIRQGIAHIATLPEQYIHLSDSRRRADRVVWIGLGRVPDPSSDVPAIAIEFVSKRRRDRVRDYEEKKREYPAVGVLEYWIIDRFERTMTVTKKLAEGTSEIVVKEGETYRTPLLPDFELPLARLLKVADDWAHAKATRKTPSKPQPPT
jgi:Uma2 family endonuclease